MGMDHIAQKTYPGCLKDDWVVTVGANGTNGERLNSGSDFFDSMTGQPEIDCIAPGSIYNILTIDGPSLSYGGHQGTSMAAAHVSGATSLIFSSYNTPTIDFSNLCSDDIDHLVKTYSTDVSTTGWDNGTGWGRLNIGAIFDSIDRPKFDILHFEGDNYFIHGEPIDDDSVVVFLEQPYSGFSGYLLVNRYIVSATFNHTIPVGYSVVGYWPLLSHAYGMPIADTLEPQFPYWIEMLSCNSTTATLRTYTYKVLATLANSNPNSIVTGGLSAWLPFGVNTPKFPYAVHIANPTASIPEPIDLAISVFPNPNTGTVNVVFNSDKIYNFNITDINGRVVCTGTADISNNVINTESLSNGLYFLEFNDKTIRKVFKIIKQ
jgi:hypothetical protein